MDSDVDEGDTDYTRMDSYNSKDEDEDDGDVDIPPFLRSRDRY